MEDNDQRHKVKVHIAAFQPFTSLGAGSYAMSYVKEISTSSDFDEMSEAKRQCQSLETVDECVGRLLSQRAWDLCSCLPWALARLNLTTQGEEDSLHTKPLCSPHGNRCYADFISSSKASVKETCRAPCRGLYIDVEKVKGAPTLLPIGDDGLDDETFQMLEDYQLYRHGEGNSFLKDMVVAKQGWPFMTSQNGKVPLFNWTCPGPKQPMMPPECKDVVCKGKCTSLQNYCKDKIKEISLTSMNCTKPVESVLVETMCEERRPLWEAEERCKATPVRKLNKEERAECRCSRDRVQGEFKMQSHLHILRIYFNAGSFDRVTRSAKTNFVSQLSLIGGTFGLFTGFSILSGIEIIYFLLKVLMASGGAVFKRPTKKKRNSKPW